MNKIIIVAVILIIIATAFYYFNQTGEQGNNSPENIQTLDTEIEAAIDSKRYYDAKELINESINIEPENPERYIQLGNLEASRGMTEEALVAWESAVALNPNDIGVRFKLAHLYGIVGEDSKAETHLEAVAEIDPEALEKGPIEYFKETEQD